MQALDVRGVTCVPKEQLVENIEANLRQIDTWAGTKFRPHNRKAWVVSAGNSFRKNPDFFAEKFLHPLSRVDNDIFTVKHALPMFKEIGLEPDFCVILDPRPIDENSTHGYNRKKLLVPFKNTIFLVASMSHPSYVKYLQDQGCKVVGWHSWTEGADKFMDRISDWVAGGSCSTVRSVSLAHSLGYREYNFMGVDSILDEEQQENEKKNNRPLFTLKIKDNEYFTTPELAVQVQDFEKLFKNNEDHTYYVHCEGPVKDLYDIAQSNLITPLNPFEFDETIRVWKGSYLNENT